MTTFGKKLSICLILTQAISLGSAWAAKLKTGFFLSTREEDEDQKEQK